MNPYRTLLAAVTTTLLTGPLGVHAGTVYKWVDENGQVHYGERPPAGGDATALDTRVNTYDGQASVGHIPLVGDNRQVTLYTTSWCGVCKRARAHLDSRGVPYRDLDIERDRSAYADYQRLGGRGVPLIVVGDRSMHGFDAARLDQLLAGGD